MTSIISFMSASSPLRLSAAIQAALFRILELDYHPLDKKPVITRRSKQVLIIQIIGVLRILRWRGFTWWAKGLWDESPPVGSRGKAPVGGLGTKSPEASEKCEIGVQFQTFSCIKFWI